MLYLSSFLYYINLLLYDTFQKLDEVQGFNLLIRNGIINIDSKFICMLRNFEFLLAMQFEVVFFSPANTSNFYEEFVGGDAMSLASGSVGQLFVLSVAST